MRDLKHLIAFENLLQEANNELVRQGKADGKRALGYTCYFMPEVLLDLPGCFAVRLRAPKCTSPDMATYYMSSRTCHYGRSLFERALEGGYNFLDADFGTETCTVTCRFQEHLGYMDVIQNPDFFVTFTDVPFKRNQNSIEHYEGQLQAHVLDPLHEKFGIDISDEALMKAIDLHNEISAVINEIGDYRKLDNPTITGYEFQVIQLCSLVCPKELILPMLKETAKELKTRKPDKKSPFRCKVVLAGSENDDPEFTKLIEGCGAEVVCDRHCYGAVESRAPIVVKDGEKPLTATISRPATARASCRRISCASASSVWPTSPRNTRLTVSSLPPTSSANTGATSARSTPSSCRVTLATRSAPSKRNTSTAPPASCVPASRPSSRASKSRRFRRANNEIRYESTCP